MDPHWTQLRQTHSIYFISISPKMFKCCSKNIVLLCGALKPHLTSCLSLHSCREQIQEPTEEELLCQLHQHPHLHLHWWHMHWQVNPIAIYCTTAVVDVNVVLPCVTIETSSTGFCYWSKTTTCCCLTCAKTSCGESLRWFQVSSHWWAVMSIRKRS